MNKTVKALFIAAGIAVAGVANAGINGDVGACVGALYAEQQAGGKMGSAHTDFYYGRQGINRQIAISKRIAAAFPNGASEAQIAAWARANLDKDDQEYTQAFWQTKRASDRMARDGYPRGTAVIGACQGITF